MLSATANSGRRRANPRILLLQVRGHTDAEVQEQECFKRACALADLEMASHNLVPNPRLTWSDVKSADVLLLGGAGDHTGTSDYSFTPFLSEVLLRWIEEGRPFFGSCYGHHFLATLFGGRVEVDPEHEEIGSFEVALTEEGRADPLFCQLPGKFWAQLGHHDRIVSLPPGLVELARSERCRFQAVRLAGRPVYGTQFHPEMDAPQMLRRLLIYSESYVAPGLDGEELEDALRRSPEACTLLRGFLDLVL